MMNIDISSSDEDIVTAVVNGDNDKFRLIVERHQKKIFNIGMRFFKNQDDAYDFVQDVFMKVYGALDSYRGRSPFRFWLTKIAYNYGINKIKTLKDEFGVDDMQIESKIQTPENIHSQGEVQTLLQRAIGKLPEKYRVCIDLNFHWGLNYRQIETITEIPVNTIKSNVARAKNILRDILKGTIAEDYDEV